MRKLISFRDSAHSSAQAIADRTKKTVKGISNVGRFVVGLFKLALKLVWKCCKGIVFVISNITGFLILLTLLVSVYGVITVIVADQLKFALNPDEMTASSEVDDSSKSYYDKAKALDLDKIEKFYTENTAGFQQWYEDYRITALTTERPVKMIEGYLLVSEIYDRPEINNSDYDFKTDKAMVLGSYMIECTGNQKAFGEGERLIKTEIPLYVNSSGYADPLGNSPSIWSNNINIDGSYSLGCTYISELEYPNLDDSQRAIYGGGGNIKAINAKYISETALDRHSDMVSMTSSDDAYKYLNTVRLNNTMCTWRGFTTWIPDAFYTYAYTERIMANGMDRDTHNTVASVYYAGGNVFALRELKDELNLTDEQCGSIMGMMYCGDRLFHSTLDEFPNSSNADTSSTSITGANAATTTILFLEGYLDSIVESHSGDLTYYTSNYKITEEIYGSISGSPPYIASMSADSAYYKCRKELEAGTTKYTYPKEWVDAYYKMEDLVASQLGNGYYSQGVIRVQYGMQSYVEGNIYIDGMERIIDACYNYQDNNGNYVFRLYDVGVSDDGDTSSDVSVSVDGVPTFGGYLSPMKGDNTTITLTDAFGARSGNHKGIDFSGYNGVLFKDTEMLAISDGEVVAVYSDCPHYNTSRGGCYKEDGSGERCGYLEGYGGGGYGNWVRVKLSNGYYAWYSHLSTVTVKAGDKVKQGQVVGTAGSSGDSTGAHLHFEIRDGPYYNSTAIDPDTILPGLASYYTH